LARFALAIAAISGDSAGAGVIPSLSMSGDMSGAGEIVSPSGALRRAFFCVRLSAF